MSLETLTNFIEWLSQHPLLAGLLIFLVAFAESLAVVGLIVPGIFFMVIFGALITTGYLDYGLVVSAAIAGAIAGDGVSYWLGRRYHQQLHGIWPFRNRPQLIGRGVAFFERHGGKSVVLGRFIGPLRPVIPAVAGMLDMPSQRFLLANVSSAILWGPIVLIPGMLFGLSLELAAEFTGRLSLLLILLLVLLWLAFWLVQQAYLLAAPRTDVLISHVLSWINRHPLIGRVPAAIVDPRHPETRVLTLLAFMLLLAALVFTAISQFLTAKDLMFGLNELVYFQLQELHARPFNALMKFFTHLGDTAFLIGICLILLIWLGIYRNWLAALHLLGALVLPLLVVFLLDLVFTGIRPDIEELHTTLNFPIAHVVVAVSVYSFIAILLSRELPVRLRLPVYVICASLILLISFSRLYLGIHWFSEVIGGIALGLIWTAILGIAYRRHIHLPAMPWTGMSYPILLILMLMASYPFTQSERGKVTQPVAEQYRLGQQAWLQSGWQVAPGYRSDLRHQLQYPLNLQWLGEQAQIEQRLARQGWTRSRFSWRQFTGWLNPAATLHSLPVTPHLHEGRYDEIRYIHHTPGDDRLLVLRLWPSALYIQNKTPGLLPLWVGNVSHVQAMDYGLMHFLKTSDEFDLAAQSFMHQFAPLLEISEVETASHLLLLVSDPLAE